MSKRLEGEEEYEALDKVERLDVFQVGHDKKCISTAISSRLVVGSIRTGNLEGLLL